MKKIVVATGTFDILHPGHLFYLEESKKLGDELWVILARHNNVIHKPKPIIPEDQRLKMISSLKCVDHAILGDTDDIYQPIIDIQPDIITLGFNQMFSEEVIRSQLLKRGLHVDIVRIGDYTECKFNSSRQIIDEAIRIRNQSKNS